MYVSVLHHNRYMQRKEEGSNDVLSRDSGARYLKRHILSCTVLDITFI